MRAHTITIFKASNQHDVHVFELWEETGAPWEKIYNRKAQFLLCVDCSIYRTPVLPNDRSQKR